MVRYQKSRTKLFICSVPTSTYLFLLTTLKTKILPHLHYSHSHGFLLYIHVQCYRRRRRLRSQAPTTAHPPTPAHRTILHLHNHHANIRTKNQTHRHTHLHTQHRTPLTRAHARPPRRILRPLVSAHTLRLSFSHPRFIFHVAVPQNLANVRAEAGGEEGDDVRPVALWSADIDHAERRRAWNCGGFTGQR
jgi:hypothetical protein